MLLIPLTLGIVLFCVASYFWGAETRPDFLDPRIRHTSGRNTTP